MPCNFIEGPAGKLVLYYEIWKLVYLTIFSFSRNLFGQTLLHALHTTQDPLRSAQTDNGQKDSVRPVKS